MEVRHLQLFHPFARSFCLFCEKNRFNGDECGLNNYMPPDKTAEHQPLRGRKKAKEHIVVLICSNANGSERFEPMFIGTAGEQRFFMEKSGRELGLDYHHIKKAWMPSELFLIGCSISTNILGVQVTER